MGKYLEFTKDVPSPAIFRLWTAIHAVGAAAERRVWTTLGINRLYPNLYVFLVGPPGTGKSQALNPMSTLLRKSQAVTLAPNDLSKQGLLDALANSSRGAIIDGRPFDYHFMDIIISEMSNFMSEYDGALAGVLTDLFDCPPANEEQKRGQGKASKMIPFPGLAMILGTATQNLGATITHDMWGSGFMARVILVFSREEILVQDLFRESPLSEGLADEIITGLAQVGRLVGPTTWTSAAKDALGAFYTTSKAEAPIHNRLENYGTRRWLHLAKLVMIAALSAETLTITLDHFNTALNWLLVAEAAMPEVFKEMSQHEDSAVYEEIRRDLFLMYSRTRRPIPAAVIYHRLSKRVASYTVPRMLEVMEAAGYIRRVAGTSGDDAQYIPADNGPVQ